ncbi:hypothetical protein [Priestia megaterium]|uniref:hypothetical protein n=1 Tax=Priestia megaterium TaxID=1404 RepID=UPI000BF35C18|nr:hypothetical protein [Priestia megaterium]PEU67524.1 hypothetical protein CN397_26405 [Priestia megaterium]
MERHLNGNIVKGERVGSFFLGMSEEVLLKELAQPYRIEKRHSCTVYQAEHMSFFVDHETKKIDQICMFEGFEGKFLTHYGVGNDLLDVDPDPENWYVDWEESCYSTVKHRGIIFGLEEHATMYKVEANKKFPIGWICIAHPSMYEDREE